MEIIDRFDGVIAGDDEFTAKVLEKGKRLKVIAKWGVGLDAIDLGAAVQSCIRVSNTPEVLVDEVADVVMGYTSYWPDNCISLINRSETGAGRKSRGFHCAARSLGS